jgi:aminopeptidase N
VHLQTSFKPVAALLNSGNLGYARVLLDGDSLKFFLANFDKIPAQLDRSQLYIIFFDCVKLLQISPQEFLDMFLKAAQKENEMATLCFLIEKARYILKYFVSLDSRLINSGKVYELLLKKAK